MAIQGELQSTDLSSVFQMLALNQTVGLLRVHDRRDFLKCRTLLMDGSTLGVANIPSSGGGGLDWVEQGDLSLDDWRELHARGTAVGLDVASMAQTTASLSEEQASGLSRHHQLEVILELFLWPDVVFSVDEVDSIEPLEGRVFFPVDRIVMESARRQDEWARVRDVLENGTPIFHANPKRPLEGDTTEIAESAGAELCLGLREFVDGIRGLDEIAGASGLSRYSTGICLAAMVATGELAPMSLDDLLITGDRLMRDQQHQEALGVFQSAARFDSRSLAIHKRLSAAHEELGCVGRAGAHLRICGMLLGRQGRISEAYESMARAYELVPTDFRALRLAINWLAQLDRALTSTDETLLISGKQLFHFFADAGKLKQARQVGYSILRVVPDDLALAVEYARILVRSNRFVEAADAYCEIAEGLAAEGNPSGAAGLFREAMELDRSRRGMCTRKIHSLQESEADRARRRRRGRWALSIAAISLLSALAYFYHHNAALAALSSVRAEEGVLEGEAAWMGQAERYSDLTRRYPLTSAGLQAESLEDNARARALAIRDTAWKKQRAESNRVKQQIKRARQSLVTGLSRQAELDLKGALACFYSAQETARAVGATAWLAESEVPRRIADIERHLNVESRGLEVMERALAQGDLESAHASALQLLGAAGDSLNIADIHVLSRSCRDRLKVPFRVVVAPKGAVLQLDDSVNEVFANGVALLDAEHPRVQFRAARPGGGSESLHLNWRTPSHHHLLAVPDEPTIKRVVGQRVVDLFHLPSGVCAVCADGSLRFWSRSNQTPHLLLPKGGLVLIEGAAQRVDDRVVLVGRSGSVLCASTTTRKWLWQNSTLPEGGQIVGLNSSQLLIQTSGSLYALDMATGQELWQVPWSGEAQNGGVVGDTAWLLTASGDIAFVNAVTGAKTSRLRGPFTDVVELGGESLLGFGRRTVRRVSLKDRTVVATLELRSPVRVRATAQSGRAVWLNEAGEIISWNGGADRLAHRVPTECRGIARSDSRLAAAADGTISVATVGQRVCRIDHQTGEILSVLNGSSSAVRRLTVGASFVYFSRDGNEGVLEMYAHE